MNVIHFRLKPLSGFATPLRGDTLIGNMLWQYLYNEGSVKLEVFLNELDNDCKNIPACSDLFPEGYLPIPSLPTYDVSEGVKRFICKSYGVEPDRKKIKKAKLLKLHYDGEKIGWLQLRENLSSERIFEAKFKVRDDKVPFVFEESELHNTINRLTGTTGEGGGLFTRNVIGYGDKYDFEKEKVGEEITLHGYLYPGIWGDSAIKLLKQVGEMGYGADASTGLGRFKVEIDKEFNQNELFELENANAWMALSRHLPDRNGATDVHKGFYTLETHYGRLGGSLATSGIPYKKPLLLFGAGSVWPKNENLNLTYGSIAKEMGYGVESKKIRHLGYTLAIPLKVTDEEVLKEWNGKEGN